MSERAIAILLGGILPALMLGLTGVFQKLSNNARIGTGPFLIVAGLTTALVGGVFLLLERDATIGQRSALYTVLFGLVWATAIGLIGIALGRFGGQISQLVPLYNMNTLIAVLIGLVVLAEWRNVDPRKLAVAAVLIVIGGIVAARA
ncbi:MAG: hypothetical protein H6649_14370 [Caldilineae bacterium]|nr:hypothetical protein [Anaerolineae bacterium]MCB0201277.1 hypothetical protein [Anaerolineae bacterium]MCB0206046.1 hypothetical protein [Anaerolineae bacterium]MCB0256824.1 hypothetical protein [Anaerolineae bacterium]MCB9155225.1 hypothetical protein [Caldilineae bacterium]